MGILETLAAGMLDDDDDGKGKNLPVSGDQVSSALGPKLLGELAKKSGVDTGSAASALAKYLPKVVDLVTPDGEPDEVA